MDIKTKESIIYGKKSTSIAHRTRVKRTWTKTSAHKISCVRLKSAEILHRNEEAEKKREMNNHHEWQEQHQEEPQ